MGFSQFHIQDEALKLKITLSLQIVEHEPSENYTLQIKFAQIRDGGVR